MMPIVCTQVSPASRRLYTGRSWSPAPQLPLLFASGQLSDESDQENYYLFHPTPFASSRSFNMISITFALLAVFSATMVSGGLLPGSGDAPSLIGSGNTASPKFQLHQNIVGSGFMEAFKWEIFDDPTHGRVNYVDQATALRKNMTYGAYCFTLPIPNRGG